MRAQTQARPRAARGSGGAARRQPHRVRAAFMNLPASVDESKVTETVDAVVWWARPGVCAARSRGVGREDWLR
ncbi:MAG: hypothetical protein ACLSVD_05155 [Eggerthellaceae bacterium]